MRRTARPNLASMDSNVTLIRVLHGVVQEPRDHRLVIHLLLREYARDRHRVRDERLAGLAPLPVVRVVRQLHRLEHLRALKL